jgi:ABC-2 type transport system permease protein
MTILGPVLIALFYGIIIWLAVSQKTGEKTRTIAVVDHSGIFKNKLENPSKIQFVYVDNDTATNGLPIDGWVVIPSTFTLDKPEEVIFKSKESATLDLENKLSNAIEGSGKNQKLMAKGLRQSYIDSLKIDVSMKTLEINESGELVNSRAGLNFGMGAGFAFIIYFFIFLYGVQVMRGVMEEKTNRIVEIIISSVKPFQLMMGKILGIAMVGLTQFLIWVLLSSLLTGVISVLFVSEMAGMAKDASGSMPMGNPVLDAIAGINVSFYLIIFLFYFLFGYLLYSSMFAAIGSAVDSESDTQQFMLPVTLPLIISFATSFSILASDPHGSMAQFMSIFPLTSPIIMMVRLPFNPPTWELVTSMLTLVATFILFTWLAGRIYRVGILMMGKKPTYKELFKWMLMK